MAAFKDEVSGLASKEVTCTIVIQKFVSVQFPFFLRVSLNWFDAYTLLHSRLVLLARTNRLILFGGVDVMTQAVLNTQLYQKMFSEQAHFKDWLMSQTPEEVLNHAYEYTCREDILLSLEYNDLSPKQAKALLKSPTPLADVFKKWDSWEDNHHMENIWSAVEARANEVVRADFIAQKDAR